MGRCDPGLRHTREVHISDEHLATTLGSGDVAVVGTPALLAFAEGCCVAAIEADLEADETSVGVWAEIEHLASAASGERMVVTAILLGHHGRRLEFAITIEHGSQTLAKVRHRRILVDRARFLARPR